MGSGSEGNGLLVEIGQSLVLMDCGFGLKESVTRMARLGLSPDQLDGIIVTHEHGDHIGGVARLARKFNLAVWLTHGTLNSQSDTFSGVVELHEIDPHQTFSIGAIEITPYPVPHDAAEPVQFVFSDGARRLAVLTDTGCSTPHIEQMLNGCDALVLECNHDSDMLMNGDYPYRLKQRVSGRFGHLDNHSAAALLGKLDVRKLQHLLAAHLSRKNNTPELAIEALSSVMDCETGWIGVASQEQGFDWRQIV